MSLEIRQLHKSFDGNVALESIDLNLGAHEFVCLLGPSGCGKTTLLRIIAGLLGADRGQILLDGRDLAHVPARERGFGIVFQSYSLFGHMSVADNVGYGLRIRNAPRGQIQARVAELLGLVKLADYAARLPGQLSGGQQQRVALARALAVDPALILLDEPLSALDARVRAELRDELRAVQRRLRIPTLMVTHDQEEAMGLADRIVCMNRGRIEQIGTPEDLYSRPATRFVAEFMGRSNLFTRDWVAAAAPHLLAGAKVDTDGETLACLRPEQIRLAPTDGAGDAGANADAQARVIDVSFFGAAKRIRVQWRERELQAEAHGDCTLNPGDAVRVALRAEDCVWVRA